MQTQVVRTTISLPMDIHQEWRMEAVKRRMSLGDVILEKTGMTGKSSDKKREKMRKKIVGGAYAALFDMRGIVNGARNMSQTVDEIYDEKND